MRFLLPVLFLISINAFAEVKVFDVELLGKKIGTTTVERIDNGKGEVVYKLNSSTEVNILFSRKTSTMIFNVVYQNGLLVSSYCKNVKDGVTEITTVLWDGKKYIIDKSGEKLQMTQTIDFSAIKLYFNEPTNRNSIFSERLGAACNFLKTGTGEYECKLANGVNNIYRYRNGMLYELEMSKGASVFMRLVQ